MILDGWIKVHRKLELKGYYKNSYYVHLWVHILLKANHKPNEFMWNGKMIKVNPGEFVTGRKQLSSETGIPETTVERILNLFEKEQQIGQQKTTKFRLIQIKNWQNYQIEKSSGQQTDNRRTTDGQQTDTNKNDKNENNDKELVEFNKFWDLYNYKKGTKEKLLKKWRVLPENDRMKIFETLPDYLRSTPDKQFRMYPGTYLNNQGWNDEITFSNNGHSKPDYLKTEPEKY